MTKVDKRMQENINDRQLAYNKTGEFKDYVKVNKLVGKSSVYKQQDHNDIKLKTQKLIKKIPESVLKSFHIPKYLRC